MNNFVDYVVNDLLADLDGVSSRAMFGGYGLYKNGIIFGMIVDDTLYFKVGEDNVGDYKAQGSKPFTYQAKNGKKVAMSYYEVPADIVEQPQQIKEWVSKAITASKKSKK